MDKTVHICVDGTDERRVMAPIRKYGIYLLLVLTDKKLDRRPFPNLRMLRPEPIRVDMNDFDDIFTKLVDIIRRFNRPDTEIYINLSGAPELVMAAMISAAYSIPKRKNVKLIMRTPDGEESTRETDNSYGWGTSQLMASTGIQRIEGKNIEIPIFPAEELTDKDDMVLHFLHRYGEVNSIKELLAHVDISRSTLQYRLEKMEEMGLIDRTEHMQRVRLKLTRTGELYVKSRIDKRK